MKKPQVVPWYKEIIKRNMPKSCFVRNFVVAFLVGGSLCAVTEFVHNLLLNAGFAKDLATAIILIVIIGLTALLTGLGIYDKLAQQVGAALAVPITGFANSVASATIEYKSEGLVLGSGCHSFKLAGAVIVFGLGAAFLVALIKLIIGYLGG